MFIEIKFISWQMMSLSAYRTRFSNYGPQTTSGPRDLPFRFSEIEHIGYLVKQSISLRKMEKITLQLKNTRSDGICIAKVSFLMRMFNTIY